EIHFPAAPKLTGRQVNEIRSVLRKEKSSMVYHVSDMLTSDGQQELSGIDLPLSINESAEVMATIKKRFHWLPNINEQSGEIVSDHVFRSPCIIHVLLRHSVVLIPDLDMIGSNYAAAYYLNLEYNAASVTLHYGIADYKTEGHIYYAKSGKVFRLPKKLKVGFYLLYLNTTDPTIVLKKTDQFLWEHFAAKYTKDIRPQTIAFERYADAGYQMALRNFWVNVDENKGGITLSSFYDSTNKTYGGRYFHNDLWFQSWFNNMRTAYGLYCWGQQLQRNDWMDKARNIARLLLSSPQNKGWFPTIFDSEAHAWLPSGGREGDKEYYMPDNAWTAYWLLRFDNELEHVPQAKTFLLEFASVLLRSQHTDGSFPSYVQASDLEVDSVLDHGAGSAMGAWFLEEMLIRNAIPEKERAPFMKAVKRCNGFLIKEVLPNQRFEDFESFFSCSQKPMHYYDSSTTMFSQNTLSMQWCAEALLKGSELFRDLKMLKHAEYCVNILSLYQQVWNPPFISFYAFGGFGAQNSDGEWSDARQAQFADTYLQFFQVTHKKEYLDRAVAACRASFALMVLPENKNICPKNYLGTEVNGELYTGSMAENYGHDGFDERSYQSGFHWGTGSALTTAAIFKATLGDIVIDPHYHIAEGINGIAVRSVKWEEKITIKTDRLSEMKNRMPQFKVINPGKTTINVDGGPVK
ncbi:MAG: hypothetical protein ABIY90_18355, partial [Puia sp.]